MTFAEFEAWRTRLNLSRKDAADALGINRNQPRRYEEGTPIPRTVALAAAAIAYGLPPIGAQDEKTPAE
jgi:transcriptional regulator with XRE-family HTH domain